MAIPTPAGIPVSEAGVPVAVGVVVEIGGCVETESVTAGIVAWKLITRMVTVVVGHIR